MRTRSHERKCRDSRLLCAVVANALLLVCAACAKLPPSPEVDARSDRFSSARARAHYAALAGLGPREPGDEAALRARAYAARELRASGAEVDEPLAEDGPGARHLVARLPGGSPDPVLIVVPWAVKAPSGQLDDSGLAALLELARAFSRQARPYTLLLAVASVPSPPASSPVASGAGPAWRGAIQAAGADLIEALEARGDLAGLRAVLVMEPRAAGAGRVARDLRSQPIFRDLFWRTAATLGHEDAFPAEGRWTTPRGLQSAFLEAGHGQVLALIDEGAAGGVPVVTASRDGTSEPPAASGSFDALGVVGFEGILRLMQRLERVDAFSL